MLSALKCIPIPVCCEPVYGYAYTQTEFLSAKISGSCSSGTYGGPFVLQEGAFFSDISQADADAEAAFYLAQLLFNGCILIPVVTSETKTYLSSVLVNYQIVSTGPPLTYTATSLPTGLSINNATGIISGSVATPGTYSIPLTATDKQGISGDGTLTLIINAPITVSLSTDTFSNLGGTGIFQVSVDGGAYNTVSSPATYNPVHQIKYKLILASGSYGTVVFNNSVGVSGSITTSASVTLLAGSSVSLVGQVGGGGFLGVDNILSSSPDGGISENGSVTLGPYNLSTDLSGSVMSSGSFGMSAFTQFALITTTGLTMETILNF